METKNVFKETVNTLVEDANSLTKQYNGWVKQGEHKKAIDTLRLLKDTLSLIKEYDWHLEYSEDGQGFHKKVSVWEQNHDGEIRNQKTWNTCDTVMYIDYDTDMTSVYIRGRKYSFDLKKDSNDFIYTVKRFADENTTIYVDDTDIGKLVCDLLDSNDIFYLTIHNMPM